MKVKRMSSIALAALLVVFAAFFVACSSEPSYDEPIMPAIFRNRPVENQGTATVMNKSVTFRLWDSEVIDGDIVTFVVNDKVVANTYTLTGEKRDYAFKLHKGYNYILLYAHNEGSLSPNTAAVSLNDGVSERILVLNASLSTNGSMNIVVEE